jgi:hypothetical protein
MRRLLTATAIGAALGSWTAPAAAQPAAGRVHVSISAAIQATENPFSDRVEFERNLETGSTSSRYPLGRGATFDAGAGLRVWKRLGIGAAVSVFRRDETVETDTRAPHPFFFETPRTVTGSVAGIGRSERAVHLMAQYTLAAGRLRAIVSAGPSFLAVEQDLVTAVVYDEAFPFDTAAFRSGDTARARGTAAAINAGADVFWMFGRRVGAGGVLRFAKAPVDLDAPGGRTVTVDAGGLTAGAGIRLVF